MKRTTRLAAVTATAAALVASVVGPAVAASPAIPVDRVAGANRIETAIEASKAIWDDADTTGGAIAGAAVISRQDDYADALGGSALAGAVGGPLLMTHSAAIDEVTLNEVTRILGGKGTVYLLGGTGAISAPVAKSLTSAGYTVKRLAGADRYATSVKVAQEVGRFGKDGHAQFVFATTGQNFPDGLAAGATAAGYTGSVVLTKDHVIPTVVKNYLSAEKAAGIHCFAVGGQAAAAPFSWSAKFTGADRYDTAAMVADAFWGDPEATDDDPSAIALATGEDWPDALAGGAFIATAGPLLLTKQASLPAATKDATTGLVKSASPTTVKNGFVLGGTGAVSDTVMTAFKAALNPAP